MATVYQAFEASSAELRSTGAPQLVRANGTTIPVAGYAFDPTTEEAFFFDFPAIAYGSGSVSVDILWYARSATSGAVVWNVSMAAITPDTDSQDAETDGLATVVAITDTHLGTTAQRVHRATGTLSGASLDSLAAGDEVRLRVARQAGNASDTMNTSDVIITRVIVSYSDT